MTRRLLSLALLLSVLAPWTAAAQPQAALSGAVLDPEGRPVANAAIVVRNDDTGTVRTTASDGSGHFAAAGLPPGAYTIEIAVPGFEIVRRSGVAVTTGTSEEISIRLSVANISESVTVSAALPEAAVAAPSQGSLTARSAQ